MTSQTTVDKTGPGDKAPGVPSDPTTNQGRGLRGHPWFTLLTVAVGVMMVALDGTIVAIANPAIAKDLGVEAPEAERIKHEEGIFGARAASLPVAQAVADRLARELVRSLGSLEPQLGGKPSEHLDGITLLGGTARLHRLDEYLARATGIPTSPLELPQGPAAASLVAGIALAVAEGALADPLGVALLLATPLCWQCSHLVVLRGLPGVSPPVLTGARYLYGGLLLGLYWALRGAESGVTGDSAALAAQLPLLAVQGTVLAYVGTLFWYQAIARLDLARATAIVVPSIPLLSLGASFALLGEVPTPRQWAGLLLAAAGVLAFVLTPRAARASAFASPAGSPP